MYYYLSRRVIICPICKIEAAHDAKVCLENLKKRIQEEKEAPIINEKDTSISSEKHTPIINEKDTPTIIEEEPLMSSEEAKDRYQFTYFSNRI